MNDNFLIKKPQITEKATSLKSFNKYVFIVKPETTKNEIKKAIKQIYGVHVIKVNVLNQEGKKKIWRNKIGRQSNFKKAIVTLKRGETINLSV